MTANQMLQLRLITLGIPEVRLGDIPLSFPTRKDSGAVALPGYRERGAAA